MTNVDVPEHVDVHEMGINQTMHLLNTQGPYCKEFNKDGVKNFGNTYTWCAHKLLSFFFVLKDNFFLYLIFLLSVSAAGCFIDKIWYSFMLVDFCIRFKLLNSVFRSVTLKGDQLILAALLILIVLYIYGVIGFFFFQEMFWEYGVNPYDSDLIGESMCQDMINCFITVTNTGLRQGGGIGDYIRPQSFVQNKTDYFWKLIYTFTFHIVTIVILLNIVFGIIIDSFAQLRTEKQDRDDDIKYKCFICGIHRSTFDKEGEGFETHIKKDHN